MNFVEEPVHPHLSGMPPADKGSTLEDRHSIMTIHRMVHLIRSHGERNGIQIKDVLIVGDGEDKFLIVLRLGRTPRHYVNRLIHFRAALGSSMVRHTLHIDIATKSRN